MVAREILFGDKKALTLVIPRGDIVVIKGVYSLDNRTKEIKQGEVPEVRWSIAEFDDENDGDLLDDMKIFGAGQDIYIKQNFTKTQKVHVVGIRL